MKILLIGHSGTLGKAVLAALLPRKHEVVTAARKTGDLQVDLTDHDSIQAMYKKVGTVDCVMVAAGSVPFAPLPKLTSAEFMSGWQNKALAQIDVVLTGLDHISESGSFVLISGILSREPVAHGAVASTVNGALESFVMAAATELPKNLRINVVSPTILTESVEKYGSAFIGFEPASAERAAMAYVKAAEGIATGKTLAIE